MLIINLLYVNLKKISRPYGKDNNRFLFMFMPMMQIRIMRMGVR
jgi:hypothetical protein